MLPDLGYREPTDTDFHGYRLLGKFHSAAWCPAKSFGVGCEKSPTNCIIAPTTSRTRRVLGKFVSPQTVDDRQPLRKSVIR